ncbi:hypothetical protein [Streptomyces sp. NPDC057413]|uniref:hypothetical protein n=1 Tax=Streptomyces sp. NPDC057413 TaxID=3346124 RepID=UPI0036A47F6E
MEILLIACMLAWTAGAQSEQAKLGLSPAQRDILRERARHEKAVRKIADKHGVAPPATPAPGVSPGKETPAADPVLTLPEAFRSGYRSHTPIERVATPLGRRAGLWTAQGVAWARDTGRGAVREYRKRRRAAGHEDPAPVLVPLPPAHPPAVPKMPDKPPTAGADSSDGSKGVVLTKPEEGGEATGPDGPEKPPEPPAEPPAGADGTTDPSRAPTGPEAAAEGPVPAGPGDAEAKRKREVLERVGAIIPEPRPAETTGSSEPERTAEPPVTPVTEPVTADGAAVTDTVTPPTPAVTKPAAAVTAPTTDKALAPAGAGGIGRMAAEVNYDSVMEESDELSLMCDEDVQVYGRIRARCEREIGRGDALIAALESVGAGQRVIAWVIRCKDQYGAIHGQLDDLQKNTLAQGEAVVKAKALLEAGQGLYADIAQDMESVADRDFYVSDAVDSEDATAHTESYETKGA